MKKHVCIRIGVLLLIFASILAVLSACGPAQVTCPSCNRKVDKLIKNTDEAGETFEWCEDCWNDYWEIINAKPSETENPEPAESEAVVPSIEELEAARLARKAELESMYGIYQEGDRYGVKFGDKSIADPIWQYIECFQYDEKLYYLITLGDKTGLMDNAGNLIIEPVWPDVYWTYESNSGDTVSNHRQKGMTTYSDQGYIILPEKMYQIDTGETVPIPSGDVIYLRGSLLVTKQFSQIAKGTITVYNFQKQEEIDSITSYRTRYYPSPWAQTEEAGDLGFFVETNSHEYDDKTDKNQDWKPYEKYGFYSFDGNVVVKFRSDKPVIFPEFNIVAACHRETGPVSKKYFVMFDMESGNQISDLSFWVKGNLNEDTGLPEIYDADGQHVMPAQTAPETGKEAYVLINLTGKNVIALPDDITAVEPFSEGLAAVQNTEGKWGYIDAFGQFVFECQFNDCSPFENGTADAVLNYKKVMINKDGSIIQ